MTNRRFSSDAERLLYSVWGAMKARCLNKKDRSYQDYGGRGISVCGEWIKSFDSFYSWAFPLYQEGLSIDRIDNDGEYSPENCRFTTRTVNATNRRTFKNSKTGLKGVVRIERKRKPAFLRALITVKGKRIYLGQFDNMFEAAAARIRAENELHVPLVAGG